MEKFNYSTDKLVIVAYPTGAGGKFLVNCLGISKDACLQDWELYDLTSTEKKKLILDRLASTPKGTWNDLDLGCFKMFENNLDGMTAEEIHGIDWEFQKIIDISHGNKYYFQTTHNEQDCVKLVNAFSNARTINFINCNQIKRDIYNPSTDLNIESEFTFDVNDYKTVTDTTNSIRRFYEHFNMKDFDSIFISEYYEKWIAHIA
jgi:hypothetical protein